MDLKLDADELAFQKELRAWLDDVALPDGLRDWGITATAADVPAGAKWQRLLFEAGWAGLHWPTAHGGRALPPALEALFFEELAHRGLPRQLGVAGPDVVGPLLMAHGTLEQQRRWLPAILDGTHNWCQLFSEPDAGSDLVSVSTRAVADARGWSVTGRKVWTSGASYADWALLLARTGHDQRPWARLSLFAVAMDRPGIAVHPILQMDGEVKFYEVVMDDVRIAPDELIGVADAGWPQLGSVLGRERLSIGAQAVGLFGTLESLRAARAGRQASDPVWRQQWTACWSRVQILRLMFLRLVSTSRSLSDPHMSLLKLAATELLQDVAELGAAAVGPGLIAGDEAKDHGRRMLTCRGATLAGGTSEIQRNIIAERVLGLPR